MTQNIYDNPEFFAAYGKLWRSTDGLDGAPEWPALRSLMPELRGRSLVDLGCGYGWVCRWAREEGAARVLGLDVSERMLERARELTADAAIEYRRADLERLELPEAAFDVVYSSLAFHYVAEIEGLFAQIQRALVAGGDLIFSVEHPIYMAPSHPDWAKGVDGGTIWPLDTYLVEGPRTTDWLAEGVIKHHRLIGTYLNLLIGLGFAIRHVEEWRPTEAQLAAHPEWADELHRPMFLLIAARR